jgi:hypothetical protein
MAHSTLNLQCEMTIVIQNYCQRRSRNRIAARSENETYSDCLLSASFVSCEVCLAAGQESDGEGAQKTS